MQITVERGLTDFLLRKKISIMNFPEQKKVGMIFEVTGVPACGKTTLLREASRLIDPEVTIFSGKVIKKCLGIPEWAISDNSILLKILLLMYAVQKIRIFLPTYKMTFQVISRMKYAVSMKVYIYVNILMKIGRYNFVKKYLSKSHVIFDEGLSHIPFNLADLHSKAVTSTEKVFVHLKEQLKDINLIVLDTAHIDIEQRLVLRGHKRLDRDNINLFVKVNKRIENGIASCGKKYFNHCYVLDASHNDLLNSFLKTLK